MWASFLRVPEATSVAGGSKEEVTSLINEMKLLNPCSDPARSKSNIGKWREIWSEQVGCMGFAHIVKASRISNPLVHSTVGPGCERFSESVLRFQGLANDF